MAYNRLFKIKVRTSSLLLKRVLAQRDIHFVSKRFLLFPSPYKLMNNVKYGWDQVDCRCHRHKVLILSQVNERKSYAY